MPKSYRKEQLKNLNQLEDDPIDECSVPFRNLVLTLEVEQNTSLRCHSRQYRKYEDPDVHVPESVFIDRYDSSNF